MTPPTENEIVLDLFKESDALLQGHFKLTSGKHSEWYFEKIRLIEKPAALEKIVDLLVEKIRREGPDFDYVVSPAYGAIAIGFLAALKLGQEVRLHPAGRGEDAFRSGFSGIDGARAVIVEDILTTGGSIQEVVACLKERNVAVAGIYVLVDRTGGAVPIEGEARREPPGPQGRGLRAGRLPLLRQGPAADQARRLGQEDLT